MDIVQNDNSEFWERRCAFERRIGNSYEVGDDGSDKILTSCTEVDADGIHAGSNKTDLARLLCPKAPVVEVDDEVDCTEWIDVQGVESAAARLEHSAEAAFSACEESDLVFDWLVDAECQDVIIGDDSGQPEGGDKGSGGACAEALRDDLETAGSRVALLGFGLSRR